MKNFFSAAAVLAVLASPALAQTYGTGIPYTALGAANGVAPLDSAAKIPVDVTQRPPSALDDNRWYDAGNGYNGFQTDTISYGSLWGQVTPTGYRQWQMRQASYQNGNWQRVDAGLPCDSFQSAAGCTAGISFYPLTASFTGSPGVLYRINSAGALAGPHAMLNVSQGMDAVFADADSFCVGTSSVWAQDCWWIPTEQMHGYTVTTDWEPVSIAIAAATGTGGVTSGSTSLVISTVTSGSYAIGGVVSGSGIPANDTITAGPAGGGAGTYTMSAAATATNASEAVALTGAGVGGVPAGGGAKLLTLNMSGCTNVSTATVVTASTTGGAVTSVALDNGPNTAFPGSCKNAGGNAVQAAVSGATFTVYPVFQVVWAPGLAPSYPTAANVNEKRAAIWHTWPLGFGTVPQGVIPQNHVLRVAVPSYNSASSWFAMLGTHMESGGQDAVNNGYHTMVATADSAHGINISGLAQVGFQEAGASSSSNRCVANNHIVRAQAGMPSVTLINEGASSVDCWENNDQVSTAAAWPGSTTTGLVFGAPDYGTVTSSAGLSWQGDAIAMMVGTTPASTGLANSYADLNRLRVSLNKMGALSPQANGVYALSAGSQGNNSGDEGTQGWFRNTFANLRSSSGKLGLKGYNYGATGQPFANDLAQFYQTNGASEVYQDSGCAYSPVCAMEIMSLRVELEHWCNNAGSPNGCAGTLTSATISGNTLSVTASGGYTSDIAPGMVISGGTLSANTTVTGFASGCYGFQVCTYTVTPSQSSSCSNCTTALTWGQLAGFIAGENKNWVYQLHQLGAGYYAAAAALASGTPTGTFVVGDRVTLAPPTGVTCKVYAASGSGLVEQDPVITISNVAAGVPLTWNIAYSDHMGQCSGTGLSGTGPVTLAGWTPTGGSGAWNGATFSVTLLHSTVPKAIISRQMLEQSTFNTSYQMAVMQPAAGGLGGGLFDDMLANALLPAPVACTTMVTCSSLGQGYGADALHDQFGDLNFGPGVYTYSLAAQAYCSGDGEHLLGYCQQLAIPSAINALSSVLPYP